MVILIMFNSYKKNNIIYSRYKRDEIVFVGQLLRRLGYDKLKDTGLKIIVKGLIVVETIRPTTDASVVYDTKILICDKYTEIDYIRGMCLVSL